MAITVYAQPDTVCSARSNVIFDVVTDSTDITTKIVAQVFYKTRQDDFYRRAGRKEQTKRAGYNYFRFNVAGLLEKLLSHNYQESGTAIKTNIDKSSIEFFVRFTEYYPSTAYVAVASTNSSTFYANNVGILTTETQGTFTGSDWYMDGVASHKFLTNSPSIQPIRASERIQLGFLTSYTDPIISVRETKNNLSTSTTTYSIGNQTYNTYLWDWSVDEDEVVAIGTPNLYTGTTYIEALSATSFYKYMPDSTNKMWGGVRLVADDDVVDIVLPVLAVATANVHVETVAKISDCDWEMYFWHTGVWNISAGSPYTTTLNTFADTSEALPAGTTKLRIKKINSTGTDELWIPFGHVAFQDNNAQNKRCQFTLDTTHIDSDTKQLEVWVEDGSANVISEVKTFLVDGDLVDATSRFWFKNLRGDFDQYTFKQGHQESLVVDKIRFESELPVGFTKADRQTSVAFVNSEIVFTSWTNYETNEILTWLKELVESKEVYLVVSDVKYAVDILNSGVDYSHHTDNLAFEIKWRFASKRNV